MDTLVDYSNIYNGFKAVNGKTFTGTANNSLTTTPYRVTHETDTNSLVFTLVDKPQGLEGSTMYNEVAVYYYDEGTSTQTNKVTVTKVSVSQFGSVYLVTFQLGTTSQMIIVDGKTYANFVFAPFRGVLTDSKPEHAVRAVAISRRQAAAAVA